MNYRKSALSTAIVTCLGFSRRSTHRKPPSRTPPTWTRSAWSASAAAWKNRLDTKREAAARVEVVTAEDIGKLPAKNVADTLQRVPAST
jgi:iron complex outermembrane receptor protein